MGTLASSRISVDVTAISRSSSLSGSTSASSPVFRAPGSSRSWAMKEVNLALLRSESSALRPDITPVPGTLAGAPNTRWAACVH